MNLHICRMCASEEGVESLSSPSTTWSLLAATNASPECLGACHLHHLSYTHTVRARYSEKVPKGHWIGITFVIFILKQLKNTIVNKQNYNNFLQKKRGRVWTIDRVKERLCSMFKSTSTVGSWNWSIWKLILAEFSGDLIMQNVVEFFL